MFSAATGKAIRAKISDQSTQDVSAYNSQMIDTVEL
jgi:hypothetical protein